jgi:hypothetical protein
VKALEPVYFGKGQHVGRGYDSGHGVYLCISAFKGLKPSTKICNPDCYGSSYDSTPSRCKDNLHLYHTLAILGCPRPS